MITYSKLRIINGATGAFVCNAVIAKQNDETNHQFMLIVKDGALHGGRPAANGVRLGGSHFEVTNGSLAYFPLNGDATIDSLETAVLEARQDTSSPLHGMVVESDFEVIEDLGVFSVNLTDLFAVEERRQFNISGILIKSAYTQNEIYSGFGVYHSNQRVHRFNTPIENPDRWRIGVELEVYARTPEAKQKITSARTNWFQCESDSSLSETINGVRELGIEIKTIPLRPCDAKSVDFWQEPMAKLGDLAESKGHSTTGLHVHISKEILGRTEAERQANLSKLCTFYTYYVEDDPSARQKNVAICGRAIGYGHDRLDNAKSSLGDFAKEIGFETVAEKETAFMKMATSVKENIANLRWDINTKHWLDYGTIEFRKGKGSIMKTRLAAICTWWEQMCLYVSNTHPRNFSFADFCNKVCREYPAVAYFLQQDEER